VTAVQTQGFDANDFTQTYRLESSSDCTTFQRLLDVSGNNQVFEVIAHSDIYR